MQVPDYGAAPISATFLVVRLLQLICMVCLIGMTANFVSEIVTSNVQPAKEMVGALVVVCILLAPLV